MMEKIVKYLPAVFVVFVSMFGLSVAFGEEVSLQGQDPDDGIMLTATGEPIAPNVSGDVVYYGCEWDEPQIQLDDDQNATVTTDIDVQAVLKSDYEKYGSGKVPDGLVIHHVEDQDWFWDFLNRNRLYRPSDEEYLTKCNQSPHIFVSMEKAVTGLSVGGYMQYKYGEHTSYEYNEDTSGDQFGLPLLWIPDFEMSLDKSYDVGFLAYPDFDKYSVIRTVSNDEPDTTLHQYISSQIKFKNCTGLNDLSVDIKKDVTDALRVVHSVKNITNPSYDNDYKEIKIGEDLGTIKDTDGVVFGYPNIYNVVSITNEQLEDPDDDPEDDDVTIPIEYPDPADTEQFEKEDPEPDPGLSAWAGLTVKKVIQLQGVDDDIEFNIREALDGKLQATLTGIDGAPMPEGSEGESKTVSFGRDYGFIFGHILFDDFAGIPVEGGKDYEYTITEQPIEGAEGVLKYVQNEDKTIYLKIHVDWVEGNLKITAFNWGYDEMYSPIGDADPQFVNTYNPPKLTIDKTSDKTGEKLNRDDVITYTVTVTNEEGHGDAKNVVIDDEFSGVGELNTNSLPEGVTWDGEQKQFTIEKVPAGQSVSWSYSYTVTADDFCTITESEYPDVSDASDNAVHVGLLSKSSNNTFGPNDEVKAYVYWNKDMTAGNVISDWLGLGSEEEMFPGNSIYPCSIYPSDIYSCYNEYLKRTDQVGTEDYEGFIADAENWESVISITNYKGDKLSTSIYNENERPLHGSDAISGIYIPCEWYFTPTDNDVKTDSGQEAYAFIITLKGSAGGVNHMWPAHSYDGAANWTREPGTGVTWRIAGNNLVNTISTDEPGADPNEDTEINELTPPAPKLQIKKQADHTQAKVGDVITYTITVTNTGNDTARNVVIDDQFNGTSEAGIQFEDGDGVTYDREVHTFTIEEIPEGGEKTITYTYTVQPSDLSLVKA